MRLAKPRNTLLDLFRIQVDDFDGVITGCRHKKPMACEVHGEVVKFADDTG
jgi:hypothetical protein